MRPQTLLRANALILVVGALALLAFPLPILARLNLSAPSLGVLALSRVLVAVLLVLATALWSSRTWFGTPAAAPAATLLAAAYTVGALLIFAQQFAIWDGRLGIAFSLCFGILALEYFRLGRQLRRTDASVAGI
jgi:hypothetical protein